MSFVRVAHYGVKSLHDSVSLAIGAPPSQGRGTRSLKVRIGCDITAELGWTVGTRLEVLWGQDADAGQVLVCKAGGDTHSCGLALRVSGGKSARTGRGGGTSFDVSFGHIQKKPLPGPQGRLWALLPDAQPAVRVPWRIQDGGLLCTIPRGWWSIGLPNGELVGRVRSLIEKGADEEAIIRATRIAPGELRAIRSALVAEQRERISKMTTVAGRA